MPRAAAVGAKRHDSASSTAGTVSRPCGQEYPRPHRRPTRPAQLARRTAGPPARGCFPTPSHPGSPATPACSGPTPQVWHISCERLLLLLGGPAAALLQLAHPLIAAGVAAHSSFQDDPLRRLRAVLNTTLTVVFGDRQQALAAATRVGEVHRRVQGRLPAASGCFPAGSPYRASDPQLALWVHATLVMVALEVVDQFVSPLGSQRRADYNRQSKPFARLFGVTEQVLPDDYEGFQAYLEACCTARACRRPRRRKSLPSPFWMVGSTASSASAGRSWGTTPCPPWS
jgi:uncharacterized protein (DUF2236 family)